MQARRKQHNSINRAPATPATPDYVVPVRGDASHLAVDAAASPALLLREQLAARLGGGDAALATGPSASSVAEYKLPMAMRLATIVALSAGLWGGLYLLATRLITV